MSHEKASSLLKRYDLSVEELDYAYVQKCQDPPTLERILRVLRSGEEGSYPHLLQYTEKCLARVHPESRALDTTSQPTRPQELSTQQLVQVLQESNELEEVNSRISFEWQRYARFCRLSSLEAEMVAWSGEMKTQEEELTRLQFIRAPLPPVRGSFPTEGAAMGGEEVGVTASPLSSLELENFLAQGRHQYQEGDFLQASLNYQKVLASDPLNAEALRGLAAIQKRARVGEPLVQEIS